MPEIGRDGVRDAIDRSAGMSPAIHLIDGQSEAFDVVYRTPNSKVLGVTVTDDGLAVDVFPLQNVLRIRSENVRRTEQPRSLQHYDEEHSLSSEEMLRIHEFVAF